MRCRIAAVIKSDAYCQTQFPGSPSNATCFDSKYCLVTPICATGDCNGQYSCTTSSKKTISRVGPSGPTSLFEPTVDQNDNKTFYDVSLASGYNVPIEVKLSVPPSGTCQGSKCVSDLLTSCTSALQITTAPTATVGPIPCGAGLYCQSGACVNNTCVIGCNDPGDQCTSIDPNCGNPANDGALQCCTAVPSGSGFTADGADYVDMYLVKNYSGVIDSANQYQTMISSNGGTPVCWGNLDCAPGQTCEMGVVPGFPADVGICNVAGKCGAAAVGQPCGQYLGNDGGQAYGYTCVNTTSADVPTACVPPVSAENVGLGTFTSPFYSGEGGLLNPEWQAAAKVAGGGTPFYQTITEACPNQYPFQYDDNSGGFNCTQNVNYTVIFGGISGSPTATATPTATPTRDRNFVGDLDSVGDRHRNCDCNSNRNQHRHANSYGNRRYINGDLYRDGDCHYHRDGDLDRNANRNADDDTDSDRDGDPAMRSELPLPDHQSRRHARLW